MSDYRIQIVNRKAGNAVVEWSPGRPIETDLIDELCARLKKRGVGIFHSEASTLKAIKDVWGEMLWDMKVKV